LLLLPQAEVRATKPRINAVLFMFRCPPECRTKAGGAW
jgi:hypothetical protein